MLLATRAAQASRSRNSYSELEVALKSEETVQRSSGLGQMHDSRRISGDSTDSDLGLVSLPLSWTRREGCSTEAGSC